MSLRFWRRIRLGRWLALNVAKGAVSLSVGPPGCRLTVGTAGARLTVGGWGTGLFWTWKLPLAAGVTRGVDVTSTRS